MNIKKSIFMLIIIFFNSFYTFSQNINFSTPIDNIVINGISSTEINKEISLIKFKTKPKLQINKRFLDEDLKLLYSTGHFSSVVAESISTNNLHILEFNLTENDLISSLSINIQSKDITKIVKKEFKSFLNKPINTVLINKRKNKVENLLLKKGYSFFSFSTIKFNKKTQNLSIKASEGIIERITFIGLNKVPKNLITRSIKQAPGSALNTVEIRKDRERLIKLGYFNFVSSPEFKKGNKIDTVEIIFKVIESKQNRISLGIEQDQNLFYGFISTTKQNFLLSSDTLFIKSQTQVNSGKFNIKNYLIKYTQPWLLNKFNIKTTLSNYNKEQAEIVENSSTYSQRNGIQFSISKPLGYRSDYSFSIKSESVSETDESYSINDYKINSIDFSLLFETITNKMNPSKGFSLKGSIEQGNNLQIITIGGITFTKITASLSNFFKLNNKLVLATNLLGGIYDSQDNTKTFENEYFVLGGATSLRGYSDFNDTITGQRNLLSNIEIRYNKNKNVQFISFIDYGNAFDNSIDLKDFKTGYGLGFRYLTPIGPIRVDIARGKENYFVHLGLGQLF